MVWGAKDAIFPAARAEPYKRDLKNLEFHLFDTGHFALKEDGQDISKRFPGFHDRTTKMANAKLTPKVGYVESKSTFCVTHK
jgi:pimeloyl-ACP methyl ester carboxylesterase